MNISTNITGTVYLIWLNSSGQFYNGSTFENYASGNYSTYDVAVTASGGRVTATPPTDASDYQLRLQEGGSPTTTDAIVDAGSTYLDSPVSEAGGSGGATAADVWSYATRTLTGGNATYTGPVDPSTDAVTFIAGDAVTLSWTKSTTAYTTIQNGDAFAVRFLPAAKYKREGASAVAELQKTGTVSISGSTITFSVSLSATETDDLATVYPSSNAPTHQIQVICTARDVTVVNAEATIGRKIEATA